MKLLNIAVQIAGILLLATALRALLTGQVSVAVIFGLLSGLAFIVARDIRVKWQRNQHKRPRP